MDHLGSAESGREHMADADVNNLQMSLRDEHPTRGLSSWWGLGGPGSASRALSSAAVQGFCVALADAGQDTELQTDPNVPQNAAFTGNYTVG